MTKLISTLAFAVGFISLAGATPPNVPPSSREFIEWCDIWISHANETNLPRVLLIGDSITRDYYPEVEKHLAGKAYVARLATSRFLTDPVLAKEIALVLEGTKFDIIHFNNGMHGWQHSEQEYRKSVSTRRAHARRGRSVFIRDFRLRVSRLYFTSARQVALERIGS